MDRVSDARIPPTRSLSGSGLQGERWMEVEEVVLVALGVKIGSARASPLQASAILSLCSDQ